MTTIDAIIGGVEEALCDLFEHEPELASVSLVSLDGPEDLSPDGHIVVVLARATSAFEKSTFERKLPIGLAAAYLADEEAAVDGFNEWLHQLTMEGTP